MKKPLDPTDEIQLSLQRSAFHMVDVAAVWCGNKTTPKSDVEVWRSAIMMNLAAALVMEVSTIAHRPASETAELLLAGVLDKQQGGRENVEAVLKKQTNPHN